MKWLMALATAGSCCLAQPAEVRRWADYWAVEYGVERELVYAVIEAESGGDSPSDIECRCRWSDAADAWHGGRVPSPKPIRR